MTNSTQKPRLPTTTGTFFVFLRSSKSFPSRSSNSVKFYNDYEVKIKCVRKSNLGLAWAGSHVFKNGYFRGSFRFMISGLLYLANI